MCCCYTLLYACKPATCLQRITPPPHHCSTTLSVYPSCWLFFTTLPLWFFRGESTENHYVLQSKCCNFLGYVKSPFFDSKYHFLVGKTHRTPFLSRPGMQNHNLQQVNRGIWPAQQSMKQNVMPPPKKNNFWPPKIIYKDYEEKQI